MTDIRKQSLSSLGEGVELQEGAVRPQEVAVRPQPGGVGPQGFNKERRRSSVSNRHEIIIQSGRRCIGL